MAILAQDVLLLKCVLFPSWRGDLGVDPCGRPPRSTAPTLTATAQRARHVHGDADCLVSVRFGDGFGVSVSHTVPYYRGYAPPHADLRLVLVGRDLAEYSMQNLIEQQYSAAERKILREIKETLCYSVLNFDTELDRLTRRRPASSQTEASSPVVELKSTADSDKEKTHELSDGNIINLAPTVSVAWKCLFQ